MHLLLTGGFLGSGKTTAIQQACSLLLKEKKKVAVITNDQGNELVDSKFINSFSIPVKEVTNGCFCCNYDSLLNNIYHFSNTVNPDIIFGESVGSCTDIIATIAKPLAALHPELTINISVFVDAYLLHSIINGTSSFIDEAVRYIFKKQMEEADILIVNKADLLSKNELDIVLQMLQKEYAGKTILIQNSLQPKDIQRWLERITTHSSTQRNSLDIDYAIYGAGEAKLAWLDAVLHIKTEKLPAMKAAALFTEIVYEKIKKQSLTIGHLKFFIDDGNEQIKISYTTAEQPQQYALQETSLQANIIVNARVQTDPETLRQIIVEAIDATALKAKATIKVQSLSAFKPGYPTPTHRL